MYQITRAETWWVLALAGIATVLFGIVAILWPGLTLAVLVWLFGAYAILYGIVELAHIVRSGTSGSWWTHLVVGIVSILAGIAVFVWPGLTAVALVYVIAFWAITIGVVEIVGAFVVNQLYLAIAGLLAVLFGLLLLLSPGEGAVALVVVIGIFAIVRGIVQLAVAAAALTTPAVR